MRIKNREGQKSLYKPRGGDFIINWGASTFKGVNAPLRAVLGLTGALQNQLPSVKVLNKPEAVLNASNKLKTFQILEEADVAIPEFTTDSSVAYEWSDGGERVYSRRVLSGHSGNGISIATSGHVPEKAPLYVKGISNAGEYRVHVANGKVIDYIKKRRHREDTPTQQQSDVRNLANGWVYTRQNLKRLERIEQLAIRAVEALGLDFGAVDIIKNPDGEVFVLEVNTACGMSDTTLNSYLTEFKSMIANYA